MREVKEALFSVANLCAADLWLAPRRSAFFAFPFLPSFSFIAIAHQIRFSVHLKITKKVECNESSRVQMKRGRKRRGRKERGDHLGSCSQHRKKERKSSSYMPAGTSPRIYASERELSISTVSMCARCVCEDQVGGVGIGEMLLAARASSSFRPSPATSH